MQRTVRRLVAACHLDRRERSADDLIDVVDHQQLDEFVVHDLDIDQRRLIIDHAVDDRSVIDEFDLEFIDDNVVVEHHVVVYDDIDVHDNEYDDIHDNDDDSRRRVRQRPDDRRGR